LIQRLLSERTSKLLHLRKVDPRREVPLSEVLSTREGPLNLMTRKRAVMLFSLIRLPKIIRRILPQLQEARLN
jgi:hypothetical protein